jgi:mRNA interferase MazF
MTVRRGEIYWVEFEPVKGSEQAGLRPALVVQQDIGNLNSPTTVVVALSRSIPSRIYPFIALLEEYESPLGEKCVVNCSQVATIQQAGPTSRLRPRRGEQEIHPIGRLSPAKMQEVDRALRYNLGL